MHTFLRYGLTALVMLMATRAFAEESCRFQNWDQLMQSALKNSAAIALFEEERKAVESTRSVAGLQPSARVAAQAYKDVDRIGNGEIEASYLFLWEDKAKRDSRLRVVDEEVRAVEARRDIQRARLKVDLVLGLSRLQQIDGEQSALQESKDTYKRLSSKLRGLPALSPEQQLTFSIFQMAEDESQTRLASLAAEAIPLQKFMTLVTSCPNPRIGFKLNLPRRAESEVRGSSPAENAMQTERRVMAAVQRSEESALERDIEIGPIVRLNREDDDRNFAVGLAFSMPLNGSERSARASESKARGVFRNAEIDREMAKIENERERWREQSRIANESLGKRWDIGELQKRHKAMESLFASGRINASLIIEGHRQILESLKARHALESMAFEAYWNLALLSGTILEEKPL